MGPNHTRCGRKRRNLDETLFFNSIHSEIFLPGLPHWKQRNPIDLAVLFIRQLVFFLFLITVLFIFAFTFSFLFSRRERERERLHVWKDTHPPPLVAGNALPTVILLYRGEEGFSAEEENIEENKEDLGRPTTYFPLHFPSFRLTRRKQKRKKKSRSSLVNHFIRLCLKRKCDIHDSNNNNNSENNENFMLLLLFLLLLIFTFSMKAGGNDQMEREGKAEKERKTGISVANGRHPSLPHFAPLSHTQRQTHRQTHTSQTECFSVGNVVCRALFFGSLLSTGGWEKSSGRE